MTHDRAAQAYRLAGGDIATAVSALLDEQEQKREPETEQNQEHVEAAVLMRRRQALQSVGVDFV